MIWTVYYVIVITGCLVTALRDVRVTVPQAVRRGDSVVLHCHYDLQGDPLYAVKWYKGRAEFYRYTPKEKPPMKLFPVPGMAGLTVDKARSNETQLILVGVTPSLSGQYNCEVSADAPSFHTAIMAADMVVVEVPVQPPTLSGVKGRYRVRDTMRASCLAAPSRPAVNLTWGLNGENVNPGQVKQYRQVPAGHPDLEQSLSVLELPLRAHHFRQGVGGRLKVRCTASLYDLYWQTTEATVEGDGWDTGVGMGVRQDWEDEDDYGDYGSDRGDVLPGVPPAAPSDVSTLPTNAVQIADSCVTLLVICLCLYFP